ncbi:MAG TPA: hypothetical protein PLJ21_03925 [Pseudobdellovibrionaceae bacterium]|nr:hypothetical protein [Pseudobdellovibrionaceae bacterium]
MHFIILILLISLQGLISVQAASEVTAPKTLNTPKTIFLVPGYFNSYITSLSLNQFSYFSSAIVQSFKQAGFRVFIVNNLKPTAGVKENGERLIQYLRAATRLSSKNEEYILVGHSAGGLYSLYAAQKNEFPIRKIVTISTPFLGLQLIDNLDEYNVPTQTIVDLLSWESVLGFRSKNIRNFLTSLKFQKSFHIESFAGFQKNGNDPLNARQLSWPFVFTHNIIGQPSDGIVDIQSSLGLKNLSTSSGEKIPITLHDETLKLDHWEQVLDAQIFDLMGVTNPQYILNQQIQFYKQLATDLR